METTERLLRAFRDFARAVRAAGLEPIDHGNGHWQIKGGPLLVNFYPAWGTIYVQGARQGYHGTWAKAIEATSTPPKRTLYEAKVERLDPATKKALKRRLYVTSKACHWCGEHLWLHFATLDHLIPLDRGGSHREDNLVLACRPCNQRRGNRMPELGAPAGVVTRAQREGEPS